MQPFAHITGQHLLSAVVDEVTGAETVSWELHAIGRNGSDDVLVDLAIPSLTPQQIQVRIISCMTRAPH
jgi:hypothetical protein